MAVTHCNRIPYLIIVIILFALVFSNKAVTSEVNIKVEDLGIPLYSSRLFCHGITKNKNNDPIFIGNFYNYNPKVSAEWFVLNLKTGKQKTFTKTGYSFGHNSGLDKQFYHKSGRIFFPSAECYINYYEPKTETVEAIGPFLDPKKGGYRIFFRSVFGSDGYLYCTTQASNRESAIARVNPETLEVKIFEKLGSGNRDTLTYGYYLEVNPPWVYVAVGKNQWELVALNTETGKSKVLKRIEKLGFISFFRDQYSIGATFYDTDENGKLNKLGKGYCYKGKLLEMNKESEAILGKRNDNYQAALKKTAPEGVPEIDVTNLRFNSKGASRIKWKMKDTADWQSTDVKSEKVIPVPIESINYLNENELLVKNKAYDGFFKYNIKDKEYHDLGQSGPSRAVVSKDGDIVYITGYPSGKLFRYDTAKPWDMNKEEAVNPALLGYFSETTGCHYSYFLIPYERKIYMAGRRERQSTGTGVGYYDLNKKTFTGDNKCFLQYKPRGMLLLEKHKKIIMSFAANDSKSIDVKLSVLDLNLKEVEKIDFGEDFRDSGCLFKTTSPDMFMGCIRETEKSAFYLYDFKNKKLLDWKNIPYKMNSYPAVNADNSEFWYIADDSLCSIIIAENKLIMEKAGNIDNAYDKLIMVGSRIYGQLNGRMVSFETTAE
ncbi:MAG: hypothetical protein ACYTFY_09295 [Planctomycetota bacterium]